MSLNIKNSETYELVKELAALKGITLTSAVKLAVREEIEREKAAGRTRPNRYDRLMAFAKEFSKRAKNPVHSWEIDALLYDEHGLPK